MNLGKLALKSVYSNASLTTRFAVHSLVCIGIMTAALWLIVSNYLVNQILDREWRNDRANRAGGRKKISRGIRLQGPGPKIGRP